MSDEQKFTKIGLMYMDMRVDTINKAKIKGVN